MVEPTELEANQIWLWGQGRVPKMAPFRDRYGLEAGLVTAVDLVRGLGVLTGMQVVEVEGATGWFDTNYAHTRIARQHVPCQHQQVVELDASLAAALVGVVADEAAQARQQHGQRHLLLGDEDLGARLVGLFEELSHLVDGAVPVRVAADVLRQLGHLAEQVYAV